MTTAWVPVRRRRRRPRCGCRRRRHRGRRDHGAPQRLARDAVARAARRGRDRARPGRVRQHHRGRGRARCSTARSTTPTGASASSTSTTWLARQHRVSFARVGRHRADRPRRLPRARWPAPGCSGPCELAPEEVVAEVTASGLRGRGGAGFPAGIKWETVRTATADVKFVCCNADEGDSGTFADRMLIEGDPFTLIEGMTIAAARGRRHRGLRLPAQRVPARDPHAAPGHRHRLRPRGARRVGARQRPPVRPRRAGGRGRLHLRRGDLDARVARGQARRGARQAADPGARGAVRPADRRQQRAHPGRGADGARRRRRGVRRTGGRALARHPGVPARRQRRARRHRRGRLRGVARRRSSTTSGAARHPGGR